MIHETCSLKNVLRCPYHSWSYDFEGNLIATPHLGGVNKHDHEDFDKSKSGLKEVRSAVWLDLIMVNISNNEIPLKSTLNHLRIDGLFLDKRRSTNDMPRKRLWIFSIRGQM